MFSLCISDGFQISVHSLLTEKQDANLIRYWLDEFVRLGGSVPHEFICDMSPALLCAAVQSYGLKPSMPEYLNSLFNILNGLSGVKPGCFVRIDIAHFIKDVAKCKYLKNMRLKHRDFFIRSVVLMIKMKSLNEIKDHILAVMVVALSQTEGTFCVQNYLKILFLRGAIIILLRVISERLCVVGVIADFALNFHI